MALIYDNRPYKTRIKECLADDFKVAAIKKAQDVFYDKRNTVVADVPEWLDFRAEAAKLRELAACLIHASRTLKLGACTERMSCERVSNA